MKTFSKVGLVMCIALGFAGPTFAATTPSLGTAATYGILASTYTNTAAGIINGDVGYTTSPVLPPTINGTIVIPKPPQAGIDQNNALIALNGQTCNFNFTTATDLSLLPQPLKPGVYCITAAASVGVGGITLDGTGTYIFRISGALDTVANSIVRLIGGASPCDVFWTPTVTTLGADSIFKGTVIDNAGITVGNNVNWEGRALNFATTITTNNSTITVPTCISTIPGTGTIINTGTGILNVIKNVINLGGGTAVPSDFTIFVHTSTGLFVGSGLGIGTPGTSYLLSSGTYTVTESVNTSYTTTFSLLLGNCINFDILSGDNKTCIVLNTYIIPAPSGGGGGGSSLLIDDCPDGDYSTSYYDGTCGLLPIASNQSIHIVKIANRLTPLPHGGGDVLYTYVVTNSDNTPISDVVVVDDKCSPIVFIDGDINNNELLDTNEVWTYKCSSNISVSTKNIATVSGKANNITVSDTDFANVVVNDSPISEAPIVPKLPKTGLDGIPLWNILIIGNILFILLISFILALRKRNI